MSELIKFICDPELKGAIPEPSPASSLIPDWLRKMKPTVDADNPAAMATVKRCFPFLDAMTMGYTIPLWADLLVEADEEDVTISWRHALPGMEALVDSHSMQQVEGTPMAEIPFAKHPMKFISPWIIVTPPGVSCLFVQPLNQFESRFILPSGVVETDRYFNAVNFPFIWREPNFKGVLPQGLPLVQVIPFVRQEFRAEKHTLSEEDRLTKGQVDATLSAKFYNVYRDRYRVKKLYGGSGVQESKGVR